MPEIDLEQGPDVRIEAGRARLYASIEIPANAGAVVIFAHGSGSSRHSPRNNMVAERLRGRGLGTVLSDLLTQDEEVEDLVTRAFRFDIGLLAERLIGVTEWFRARAGTSFPIGYFGSSTGAAAALIAASRLPDAISAVVSRGGRADLAEGALEEVAAPTLLIVGGNDRQVLRLNEASLERLSCVKQLTVIEGATHLFEEPGALEEVASAAADWFETHLVAAARTAHT